jgi:hypothetical protein
MLTISLASTLAPFASSASTASTLPEKEAEMSGVRPSCSAGEHRGKRLPPLSYRSSPACPHQHTLRVALRLGPCRPPPPIRPPPLGARMLPPPLAPAAVASH